ncbi:hypothetical protein ANO11243_096980 [Dothideomycetidae sp. 11243]|nr:hypothetical protein ANO11243_096980 [fungal sp. No.11243]
MVQLLAEDIATKEVLSWKGLHLFHARFSSTSQKLRVVMGLKGLSYISHLVDLVANEHLTPYFFGINPRGRVPVLIDDGKVYIESNDIMLRLEQSFTEPKLIPEGKKDIVVAMLHEEDKLHFDLRTLTFRFMFDPSKPIKSAKDLEAYNSGSGKTVAGQPDHAADEESGFWRSYLDNGVDDASALRSAQVFRHAFDGLERALEKHDHILGDKLSLVDVAWLTDVQRLTYAGYPFAALHPKVEAWRRKLMDRTEIGVEFVLPPGVDEIVAERLGMLDKERETLVDVCFPDLRDKT